MLVTRIVHINIELTKQHHEFLTLRILLAILMYHWFLKEILGSDWRHFWSTALPFSFNKHLTHNVIVFPQLLLLLLLLLLQLHLLLLGFGKFSIRFIGLSNKLFGYFTVLKVDLTEGDFLDQRT